MGLLTANRWARINGGNHLGRRDKASAAPTKRIQVQRTQFQANVKAFATRKSTNKKGKSKEEQKDLVLQTSDDSPLDEDSSGVPSPKIGTYGADDSFTSTPSKSSVLQACSVTSGLIAVLGLGIRQVSHAASSAGLPILDCGAQVTFDLEVWHLELIAGLVVSISSCRYLLLKTWPDFAQSSERANEQVLTSLDSFEYVVLVAFLPGISEELLFRGALLPLFGLNWKSALVTAAVFGILHLGNGRNYSFVVWATFVGLAYAYATIASTSALVPITSHALNNLVAAILWRYTSKSLE